MKESTAYLSEAKKTRDQLRIIYQEAMDEEALLQCTESLLNEIDGLVSGIATTIH